MSDVLAKLEQRWSARESELWELARQLADGKPLTEDALHARLVALGRSPADLRKAVETITKRRALQAKLRRWSAVNEEIAQIEGKIQDEDRRLDEAENAHTAAVRPLLDRLKALRDERRELGMIQERLIAECPDRALCDELRRLNGEFDRLRAQADDLASEAREKQFEARKCPEAARDCEKRAAELLKAAAQVRAELAATERARQALLERMANA